MRKINPEVDIVMDVLKATLATNPTSTFTSSLLYQYQERGSLSKKQLEGLYHKASKVEGLAVGKLATLQAIILKKVTKEKAPASKSIANNITTKDVELEKLLVDILSKYPQHKRVVFLKMKFDNNEPISPTEKAEVEKFHKLLLK